MTGDRGPGLPEQLVVRGARENNLRGVDLDLPHRRLVVFTGVSGSGKSSLAFDTIYAEGQRRQVQSMSSFARRFLGEMDKPDVDRIDGLCSAVAVDQRSSSSRSPRSTVGTVTEIYDLLRVVYAQVGQPHCTVCQAALVRHDDVLACPDGHQTAVPEMYSRSFSFNLPFGQCAECAGLGTAAVVDPALVVPDGTLSLAAGAIAAWRADTCAPERATAVALLEGEGHTADDPWDGLPAALRETLLDGRDVPVKLRRKTRDGETWREGRFTGVMPWLRQRIRAAGPDAPLGHIEAVTRPGPCPACGGGRLNPAQLAVTVAGMGIGAVSTLPISACARFFTDVDLSTRDRAVVAQALDEITERLEYLVAVGLGYLSLHRAARSLSGGESQRIRLASQLGTRLFGQLYVLDEPTAGLHPRDGEQLISTLHALRDQGNSVIVVEHDHNMIRAADWVVEVGPGAGEHGGELVFAGTVEDLLASDKSITSAFLDGRRSIAAPQTRREPAAGREIVVRGARQHNLAGVDVRFPLGCFIAVSGVSGAGKSTLVDGILYRAADRALGGEAPAPGVHDSIEGLDLIDRVIRVDQSPIGRSGRSTPATYTGVIDHIRKVFTQTDEARSRGYKPGRFSFNSPGGRCDACSGDGTVRIEMYFLPDVFLPCDACRGSRYNEETLQIRYRDRNIAEVLDMPIDEAAEFFAGTTAITDSLQVMRDVGLGYLRLGQSANTLSGGEAQRVKLAIELQRKAGQHTLYLLDEPTTGLHSSDIDRLMTVLHSLVDAGHTVIAVSHNVDVVAAADWVIDLGPDGGDGGGQLIAAGTPEVVRDTAGSHTGRYLAASNT
ncbi:MAG TPA: excinuclease ABC subunit UvrA [Catenuloplanes sp.]